MGAFARGFLFSYRPGFTPTPARIHNTRVRGAEGLGFIIIGFVIIILEVIIIRGVIIVLFGVIWANKKPPAIYWGL